MDSSFYVFKALGFDNRKKKFDCKGFRIGNSSEPKDSDDLISLAYLKNELPKIMEYEIQHNSNIICDKDSITKIKDEIDKLSNTYQDQIKNLSTHYQELKQNVVDIIKNSFSDKEKKEIITIINTQIEVIINDIMKLFTKVDDISHQNETQDTLIKRILASIQELQNDNRHHNKKDKMVDIDPPNISSALEETRSTLIKDLVDSVIKIKEKDIQDIISSINELKRKESEFLTLLYYKHDKSKIESDIFNLKKKIKNNKEFIDVFKQNISEIVSDITNINKEISSKTSAITNLNKEILSNTSDITNLNKEISSNTTKITNLNQEITSVKSDVQTYFSNMNTHNAELQTQLNNLSNMDNDIMDIKSKQSTVESEYNEFKNSMKEAFTKQLDNNINTIINNSKSEINKKMDSVYQDMNDLTLKLTQMSEYMITLKPKVEKIDNIDNNVNILNTNINQLHENHSVLTNTQHNTQGNITELEKNITNNKRKIENLEFDIHSVKNNKADVKIVDTLSELNLRVEEIKKNQNESEKKMTTLISQNLENERKISNLFFSETKIVRWGIKIKKTNGGGFHVPNNRGISDSCKNKNIFNSFAVFKEIELLQILTNIIFLDKALKKIYSTPLDDINKKFLVNNINFYIDNKQKSEEPLYSFVIDTVDPIFNNCSADNIKLDCDFYNRMRLAPDNILSCFLTEGSKDPTKIILHSNVETVLLVMTLILRFNYLPENIATHNNDKN